jgi:hypothetical protein
MEKTFGMEADVTKFLDAMQNPPFYARGGNSGLFAAGDVILIKINSQWDERGGTNTDLLASVIKYITRHPDGFTGEIVIVDNGQGMFGSQRVVGSLDWPHPNSQDKVTSAQKVANSYDNTSFKVSGVLFDNFTKIRVKEFMQGDNTSGYVLEDTETATNIVISYPKFTTRFGTKISFKRGVWDGETKSYNSEILKVINMPVLKNHGQYQVTGAIKSYMGIPSNSLTHMSPHNSVGLGGMGTLMANTRFPTLNILDMIYIAVDMGPASPYSRALENKMIATSTDPVALDYWAARNVLLPAAEDAGNRRAKTMSPDADEPGNFGYWLRLTVAELQKAGLPVTITRSKINVIKVSR